MFWKKWTAKIRNHRYRMEQEDLAVPEVHTGKVDHPDPAPAESAAPQEDPITYDNVAIPEIHLKRKKRP